MAEDQDARLTELETQQAFQEQLLQQLNDALIEQQQRLDKLEVMVRYLHKRLEESSDGLEKQGDADPPPPHY